MSNQQSKSSPASTPDVTPAPASKVKPEDRDLEQNVRHAAGQPLGKDERLSPDEASKLAGDRADDTKP